MPFANFLFAAASVAHSFLVIKMATDKNLALMTIKKTKNMAMEDSEKNWYNQHDKERGNNIDSERKGGK